MADEPVILEQLASRAHIGTDESGKVTISGPGCGRCLYPTAGCGGLVEMGLQTANPCRKKKKPGRKLTGVVAGQI